MRKYSRVEDVIKSTECGEGSCLCIGVQVQVVQKNVFFFIFFFVFTYFYSINQELQG